MACERCGGFKVSEYFYGADSSCGFWSYQGYRCVNCGAITVEREELGAETTVAPIRRELTVPVAAQEAVGF
jgi:methionyl-tRNA synthetase